MTPSSAAPASPSRSRRSDETLLALVIEDEASHRYLLEAALTERGMRVVVAPTGFAGLRLLDVHQPDIVFVDLGLPDFDGLELCRRIRLVHRCPVIVVTADGDEASMVIALENGADDYIVKPWSGPVLMARTTVALRHAAAVAAIGEQSVFQVGDVQLDVEAHEVLVGGEAVALTPRQFRLLTALMRNAGRVMTHKQLAQLASPDRSDVTNAASLKSAMSQLRKRLGTGPHRPRLEPEPFIGYRLVEPPSARPDSPPAAGLRKR